MSRTSFRCMTIAPIAALLLCTLAVTVSCRVDEEPEWTTHQTPLEVDPVDYVHLVGWWSNGQQLLRLESDGGYRFYQNNVFAETPLHQGRWEKHTHARIRLDPYEEASVEPLSVEIHRIGDEYVLWVPEYGEFQKTAEPDLPLRFEPPPFQPMSSNTA